MANNSALPDNFLPAAVRARQLNRYFVQMKAPAVADAVLKSGASTSAPQKAAAASRATQEGAIAQAKSLGGAVTFRYRMLINAFSARLSAKAAAAFAQRADVRSVEPVSVVRKSRHQRAVHRRDPGLEHLRVRGQGMQ